MNSTVPGFRIEQVMRFRGTAVADKPADLAPVVLVTEDDVLVRATVSSDLRAAGYTVIETAAADEAIDVFKSGTVVDAVFADISLAGARDGYALAEWVRVNRPWVDVLLTTGTDLDPQDEAHALFPLIPKPYVADEIAEKIRTMLLTRGVALN